MIDTDPNVPGPDDDAPSTTAVSSDDPVATADTPRSKRWPWLLALLLLCAIAALFLVGIQTLRDADGEHAERAAQAEQARQQIQRLQQEISRLNQEQQRVAQRVDSSNATNKVLREEILGMGERATMLEEAVARVAQSRIGGESALRLNEAEFLLTMGGARLALYGDAASTIEAFSLAEDALSGLDDPALATLRQTLAQELEQLRTMPPDPRVAIRTELATLAAQLTTLPAADASAARNENADDTTQHESRLTQLLSRLVTVRRYDPQASLLGPSQHQAALATLALQLELAQAALNRLDHAAFRAALTRVEDGMANLFDQDDESVQRWRERLLQLRDAELEPVLPALGATRRELRNLRTVRGVPSAINRDAAPSPETPTESNASDSSEPTLDTRVDLEPAHPANEQDDEAETELENEPESEPEPADSHGVRP